MEVATCLEVFYDIALDANIGARKCIQILLLDRKPRSLVLEQLLEDGQHLAGPLVHPGEEDLPALQVGEVGVLRGRDAVGAEVADGVTAVRGVILGQLDPVCVELEGLVGLSAGCA